MMNPLFWFAFATVFWLVLKSAEATSRILDQLTSMGTRAQPGWLPTRLRLVGMDGLAIKRNRSSADEKRPATQLRQRRAA